MDILESIGNFLALIITLGTLWVVFSLGTYVEGKNTQRQKEITVKSVSALASEFKCTTTTPGEKPIGAVILVCNDGRTIVINGEDGTLQVLKK